MGRLASTDVKDTRSLPTELAESLKRALKIVNDVSHSRHISQLVWKKQKGIAGWSGQYENRPELITAFGSLMDHMSSFERLEGLLKSEEPEMLGAFVWIAKSRRKCRLYDILSSMVSVVWRRHGTLLVSDQLITQVVDELLETWHARAATVGFIAPILNFTLRGVEKVAFPNGVTIRRMSEMEATHLYGGLFPAFKSSFAPSGEFAFVGQFQQPLGSGDSEPIDLLHTIPVNSINAVERAMMTFKAGPVAHEWISMSLAKPSPVGTLTMGVDKIAGTGIGTYEIDQSEIPDLIEEFTLLESVQFPALSLACARLVDSERRTSPIDRLMDAVIGLESLLLDGSDREGLRFRFGLNYATFKSELHSATKQARFRQALDVYKIRSQVVHAGTTSEKHYDFAGEKMTLTDVSVRAVQMLRSTVNGFLRLKGLPSTTKERERWLGDFWQRGYFGMR